MKKKVFGVQILAVFLLVLILVKINLFGVSSVMLENPNNGCINEEAIKANINLVGKNLFLIDKKQALNTLVSKYPCVKDIDIKLSFPRDLKVEIVTRTPFARVLSFIPPPGQDFNNLELQEASSAAILDWNFPSDNSDNNLVVDDIGSVFRQENQGDLPMLFIRDENLKVGGQLDETTFVKTSSIFRKLKEMEIIFSRSKIDNNILLVDGKEKLSFSLQGDILRQLASLQLILQEAKINGKVVESLNLRFNKPVVVYTSKK